MPEDTENPATPWLDAWVDAQKAALEQWVRQEGSAGPDSYLQGLDAWWAAFAPGPEANAAELSRRLFDTGRSYLLALGQLAAQLNAQPDRAQPGADAGASTARSFIDGLRQAQGLFAGAARAPVDEVMATWQRLAGSSSRIWQALARQAPGAGAETPAIGFTREYQEELQALGRAALEYQRRLEAMAALVAEVHAATFERLLRRLEERERAGEAVDSFRGVYDLWIECGEQSFQKTAHGDEYACAQAELTNAYAALRVRQQALNERMLVALDLPNRKELNTTHRRVRELKERIADLEAALGELRGRFDAEASAAARSGRRGSRKD